MKNQILFALMWSLAFMQVQQVAAQTFTLLHSFTAQFYSSGVGSNTNSDGANPQAALILSGNTLFGTAFYGGAGGAGTVFRVNTDGTAFTNLHSFTAFTGRNDDGNFPSASLALSGNTLYGTARQGGSVGGGTLFTVNTDGTGFSVLHNFTGGADGSIPNGGVILSGGTLYGAAGNDGLGYGTVFAVSTNGAGFTTLYSFTNGITGSGPSSPQSWLALSDNTLYGTTLQGGSTHYYGTIFAINSNGTGVRTVHSFTNGGDGYYPTAGVILSGSTLYGMTRVNVFAANTNGTTFTKLHNYFGETGGGAAGLILSGNKLYGTTASDGSSGHGTVFAVNIDGTGYTNLYNFTGGSDGANPSAGLILSGNILYGTTQSGGISGNGTVFSLSLGAAAAPLLTIKPSGTNVVLTWPTDATGFTLQSATNLVAPVIWSTNLPAPAVVNGQNTVTNPNSGPLKFYRLSL